MNNPPPFGAIDWDRADRGRGSFEKPSQADHLVLPIPISWRRLLSRLYPTNNQRECLNCKRIDFNAIFDGNIVEKTGIAHSTLFDAVRNTDCPLCQYITQVAERRFGVLEASGQKRTVCTIHHDYGWIGHARIEKTELHTSARIEIRIQHQCEEDSYRRRNGRLSTEKFALERVGVARHLEYESSLPALVRKSMGCTFDSKKLLKWLERSDHGVLPDRKCPSSLDMLLREGRFRVVDVTTNEIVTLACATRYVALSYVWGKSQDSYLATNHAAVQQFTSSTEYGQRLDLEEIPWTIRDGLDLVKSIDERYLWVDSLCISQHDAEDKAMIISEMSAIYGNAYLTIIATDGSDASSRISRLSGQNSSESPITFTTKGLPISLLPSLPGVNDVLKQTVWNSRGWTLQERFLSSRSIIFTKSGVFFECEGFSASEAYGMKLMAFETAASGNGAGQGVYNKLLFTSNWNAQTYDYALQEYTTREFSHPGDRLDAFTGILRQLSPQRLSVEHLNALSGLPKNGFIQSLYWLASDERDQLIRLPLDARGSRYLPSWSWAGWKGAVRMDTDGDFNRSEKISIVDAANIVYSSGLIRYGGTQIDG